MHFYLWLRWLTIIASLTTAQVLSDVSMFPQIQLFRDFHCSPKFWKPKKVRGTLVILLLTLSSVMLGKMGEIQQLAGLDSADPTPDSICVGVAKIFRVTKTEVALLELSGSLLNFLYPVALRTAGAIPLSSSAVAARTARTKQAELFNGFAQVTR